MFIYRFLTLLIKGYFLFYLTWKWTFRGPSSRSPGTPDWLWKRRAASALWGVHSTRGLPGPVSGHLLRRNQAQNVIGLNISDRPWIKIRVRENVTFHSTPQYRCCSVANRVATYALFLNSNSRIISERLSPHGRPSKNSELYRLLREPQGSWYPMAESSICHWQKSLLKTEREISPTD